MLRRKILIVEDSPTQANMLRFILEKNGYDVLHCLDGKEALNIIPGEMPGLVISDIIMPGMNGYELCKRIKDEPGLNSIPVLLLTSLADAEDIIIGLESGADNYLMKPYDENLLVEHVQAMFKHTLTPAVRDKNQLYEIIFDGKKYKLSSSREKILDMMVSVYQAAIQRTLKLQETQIELKRLKTSLKSLILERTKDISKNIEQRKIIEENIKKSEKQYRNLIENVIPGVFLTNEKWTLTFVNQSLLKLLGYKQFSDLLNQGMNTLFVDEEDYLLVKKKLIEQRSVKNIEVKLKNRVQTPVWVNLNLAFQGSQVSGYVIDISGRKAVEEKEKRFQEALRITKEKAEESSREKSAFLSSITYDIKTPLNAIAGFSSLLNDPTITEEQKKAYHLHIVQNTNLLTSLIGNILELSKIEAARTKIKEVPCRLNKVLDDLYEKTKNKAQLVSNSGILIELIKANEKEDYTILIDQEHLVQVFENLLDNALKFTRQGNIRFGYDLEDKEILFFVKDTGIGIEVDEQRKVLERFHKARSSGHLQSGGAGLGLTISHQLVQLMQGQFWLNSDPGKGTEVFFRLELKEKHVLSPDPIRKSVVEETASLKGKHILVADDNEMNFILIKAFLDDTETSTDWAKDGVEAVQMCRNGGHYDMVLMDLQMPNMDGFEATTEIKALRPKLPVIAVTAYSKSDILGKTEKVEFDGYLKKPLLQNEFLRVIQSYSGKNGDFEDSFRRPI